MSLADRFRAFFAAANGDAHPYPWQIALVERIAETGAWPAAITAPTGSGKSSVVDVHVFLVAERERQRQAGSCEIARPPRRLVLVAPRRVLVDDQHERATRLAGLLAKADDASPLGEARVALAALVTSGELLGLPLGVARLRGGVRLDLSWRLDPARCQIVCATPQMWGSRLLLRGYRGSTRSRNLESGLLAHDVAVVIDEAHLHRRLVATSRRVAAMGGGAGRLQVVAMSATHSSPDAHALSPADYEDERLARRVRAPKSVLVELVANWPQDRPLRLAAAARDLRAQSPDAGTVGVFVNTVAVALDVAERLRSADGATVCVICGRMRPADLARVRDERPGLLDARGNRGVDFLVSTQSLEVGVDLDLGAMVSELAPASALAQRAGRLNRSGSRPRSGLVVIAPEGLAEGDPEAFNAAALLPYAAGDLRDALGWLDELAGDGSPDRIGASALPEAPAPSVPDITSVELETLSMTSIALAADPDPSFYIEEPVESADRRVAVAARDHLGDLSDAVIRTALAAAPPRAHELAAIRVGKALDGILAMCPHSWTIRVQSGATEISRTDPAALRNGDVIVIPAGSRVSVGHVLGVARGTGDPIDDVVAERPPEDGTPDVIVRMSGEHAAAVAGLVNDDPVLGTRAKRTALADTVHRSGDTALARRLRSHRRLSDLTIVWCADEEHPDAPGLLVVVASDREGRDSKGITEAGLVTVDDHRAAVAQRADEIVLALDALVADERDDVVLAARLHDEGKRHPEFQQRMGAAPDDPALAKPKPRHKPDPGDGWRHEQLSAGIAHAHSHNPLVTTLVAAHHGNGRPLFLRDDRAALADWGECRREDVDALAELFGPHGRYEADRAALEREHGVHRLAYLEALVRCADIQISREVPD